MPYEVIIENRAQKEFCKLHRPWNHAVGKAISQLADTPRPAGVKKLSGSKDGYRVRTGDYRVLYTIDDRRNVVSVYRIRNRKEAYR
jgi:mRNA interferase RelE/StbE